MQPGSKKLLRFLQSWLINTVAVMVTVIILRDHISYSNPQSPWLFQLKNLLEVSFLLGMLNAFVRPILWLIALPLVLLTLLLPFFHITSDGVHFSFLYAFLGALVISLISSALNLLTGGSRVSVPTRTPKKPGGGGSGDGPVIDV